MIRNLYLRVDINLLKQVDTQMKTIWSISKGSDRKTLAQAIEVEKSGILRQKK